MNQKIKNKIKKLAKARHEVGFNAYWDEAMDCSNEIMEIAEPLIKGEVDEEDAYLEVQEELRNNLSAKNNF